METILRYHRYRISAFMLLSTEPLVELMGLQRGKAAYTQKLYHGDLCAVHYHIVLVLVLVLKKDEIELEEAVSLLPRE
jgi:hypothetical protein